MLSSLTVSLIQGAIVKECLTLDELSGGTSRNIGRKFEPDFIRVSEWQLNHRPETMKSAVLTQIETLPLGIREITTTAG